VGLREQMARYIRAAQEFLIEYLAFLQQQHPLDQFSQRLSKKINTLETLQSSNDIAMQQMYLSQQLAFSLLDRFKEAQQVLLPAWQYHIQHSQNQTTPQEQRALDASRNSLINSLKHALEKSSQSSHSR
jgi:regulatory protein YycI of two-component signal transduction system YycFG